MGTEAPATRFAGTPHLRSVSTHHRRALTDGWRVTGTVAGEVTSPAELERLSPEWLVAEVPGTVASALRTSGRLPPLERCDDLDARDWWFRVPVHGADPHAGARTLLRFGGLASLAEIWLDGELIASSRNMYREVVADLSERWRGPHDLIVRFPSLRAELDRPRRRARWRSTLVEHQALRWFRTTLLGRMPGWCAPVRPVGPWQPVWLEQRRTLEVVEGDVMPWSTREGDGLVIDLVVRGLGGARLERAELATAFGRVPLDLQETADATWRLTGTSRAPDVVRWWPHTHGPQPRYAVAVLATTSAGPVRIDLGAVAFRSLVADRSSDGFTLLVNGVPVFCRGACWSPTDIVTVRGEAGALRRRLELVRDAGMNMLRVSGVMAYEDARFHRWCDELGILVWQDFMFARMDYPAEDAPFVDEVRAEASEVVAARRRYASTAVWCGNSEVAQTASMLGLESDTWSGPLFDEVIPGVLAASGHDAPYLPGTPTGGALPFVPSSGTSHYFGVGALLRPLEDARRAGVRFATESLGLANVGEGPELPSDPGWSVRVPRDAGATWDFEDVRDHYAAGLFGLDVAEVRRADPERYVAMARVTSSEVMRRTFAEWRRSGSTCAGALVWLLSDPWHGPGWGLLDAEGRPKAPWHALRRVLAPQAVFLTDEGLNGLVAHVANDAPDVLAGTLEVSAYRDEHLLLVAGVREVEVAPHSTVAVPVDAIVGRFTDLGWSYRFGPAAHDVVVIELRDHTGTLVSSDLYLPLGLSAAMHDVPLTGRLLHAGAQDLHLELGSDRLAYAVRIEAGDWFVVDNYAHVPPGRRVAVRVAGPAESRPAALVARAFNGRGSVRIEVPPLLPD